MEVAEQAVATLTENITEVAAQPGELPEKMVAWVIREEREGEPKDAFQLEEIEVPEPGVTRWKVGDEVVIHCNQASYEDPEVHGLDPMAAPSQRIWGYETTWGSFAQFTKVQAQQLLPKPKALSWEEAASYGLVYFTAYRMLLTRCNLQAGQRVLIWGGAGGLGVFAIQLCKIAGAHCVG